MATADLPNPSYEFCHLLWNTGSCLEAFIHTVNSLSHKTMSVVVYLMALHKILRLFSDGVMRRLCTVNRKFIWRLSLWSVSRTCIRIRRRSQKKAPQSFQWSLSKAEWKSVTAQANYLFVQIFMLAITSDRFTSNMTRVLPALLEVMVFRISVHYKLLNTSESTNWGASWNERFPVYYYTVPLLDWLATQKLTVTMQHETFWTLQNTYSVYFSE